MLSSSVPVLQAQDIGDLIHDRVALFEPESFQVGKQTEVIYRSRDVQGVYNGIVLQGYSSSEDVQGWIRFLEKTQWTDWLPLYVVHSATDAAFLAAYRSDTFRAQQDFELRFLLEPDDQLTLSGAGTFDNRLDVDTQVVPYQPQEWAPTALQRIIPPTLHRRSEWGAEPFIGDTAPLARPSYDYMTFHHTAGWSASTLDEGLRQVKLIQAFHQNGRGWSDIGYHFVIDRAGNLYQGRPFQNEDLALGNAPALVLGAHAGGANTGNIGVSLLGCYHPPEGANCEQQITPQAYKTYTELFAFFREGYQIPTGRIRGHRDFGATACPGDNNYALLPELRVDVEHLLLIGNEPLGTASLTAEPTQNGVVRLEWEIFENNGISSYYIERRYPEETSIVVEATGAAPDSFIDTALPRPGEVVYALIGRNDAGREQILAFAELNVPLPGTYALAGNFPNPFSDRTTIRYYLEREGIVRLYLYDRVGRLVRTLVDTHQSGDRWYTVPLEAGILPGGVYFVQLQVEGFAGLDFEQTAPLTLIR